MGVGPPCSPLYLQHSMLHSRQTRPRLTTTAGSLTYFAGARIGPTPTSNPRRLLLTLSQLKLMFQVNKATGVMRDIRVVNDITGEVLRCTFDIASVLSGDQVISLFRAHTAFGLERVTCPAVAYDPAEEDPIVNEPLGSDPSKVAVLPCTHRFKWATVEQLSAPRCPLCNMSFNDKGPQPTASMTVTCEHADCEGYPGFGSLRLIYDMPDGVQTPLMPSPGTPYAGDERTAWLPCTYEGLIALRLLIQAFRLGHLFAVGTSLTTGEHNVVIWGAVHQKTSRSGGGTSHGWDDPAYFGRLADECRAVGVK